MFFSMFCTYLFYILWIIMINITDIDRRIRRWSCNMDQPKEIMSGCFSYVAVCKLVSQVLKDPKASPRYNFSSTWRVKDFALLDYFVLKIEKKEREKEKGKKKSRHNFIHSERIYLSRLVHLQNIFIIPKIKLCMK